MPRILVTLVMRSSIYDHMEEIMNFQHFQVINENSNFDEIKVIGMDIQKEGKNYHIIGMTRKAKEAFLYVLETPQYLLNQYNEEETGFLPKEKTHRVLMKESMETEKDEHFFLHVREFRNQDTCYEMAGGQAGGIKENDYLEACLLFLKMSQAGWKLSEESPFYDCSWEFLAITKIEFRGELEQLPEWNEDMELVFDTGCQRYPVEKPVLLECGKTAEIAFELENGKQAMCYINKVELHDVWAEQEQSFADLVYRERVLQRISEEEFEEMQANVYRILEEHCPRGKCYIALEYECSEENIGLNFYDKEYLDSVPIPSSGNCSSMMMRHKPEKETGIHGLKLRGEIIQKPLDKDALSLEAELFSYYTMVEKKSCKLSELVFRPRPKVLERVLTEEEKERLVSRYNLIKPESV